jgi:hypothetical protein
MKTIMNENITKRTWKEEKMEALLEYMGGKERNFVKL